MRSCKVYIISHSSPRGSRYFIVQEFCAEIYDRSVFGDLTDE